MEPNPLPDGDMPRLSARAFLLVWAAFWLLLLTVSVQDYLRQGRTAWWPPVVWEGTSCLVASVVVVLLWGRVHRIDHLLAQPWRWFCFALVRLPVVAVGFVAVVFALRHGIYALLGQDYRHEGWPMVFAYESVKFGLFYLLFVAIVFGMRSHAAMGAARIRAERLRTLGQQAQLLQLAQQIQPHFLFNALNTIASCIHTDPALADTLLLRLAALLRAATDLTHRPEVPLAEELRLLRAYTEIMAQRFAGRVEVCFETDPACGACLVPALALQPLVENVFRHGVEQHARPGRVTVRSRMAGNTLVLEVEDDLGTLVQPLRWGTGLSNLRQRLALRHGAQAALALAPRPQGGVLARITLPCVY